MQRGSLLNYLSEIRSNFSEYFDKLMKKNRFLKNFIDRLIGLIKNKVQNGILIRIAELF